MNASQEHMNCAALFEFVHMAPVGLLLTEVTGEIEIMNAFASQFLMPFYQNIYRDVPGANFFQMLDGVAPELHDMAEDFDMTRGIICQNYRIQIPDQAHRNPVQAIGITISKLGLISGDHKLMIMVSDETKSLKQEQQLLS